MIRVSSSSRTSRRKFTRSTTIRALSPAERVAKRRRGRGRLCAEEREAPHHPQAAAGARAVRERSGLPGPGWAGADRRRVHRAHHGRPPLGGRAAPGGRGEGERAGEGRDPDARHDHDSELLPDVRQAGRHDRHGRDGGDRVLHDLRARGLRHPDQQAGAAGRRAGPHLQDPAREEQFDHRRGRAAARARAAGPDRYRDGRGLRDALPPAQAARPQARSAEREVPPARSGDRGRRGPEGCDHDRHQHGRPRHRHQAGRRPGPHHRVPPACRSSAPNVTSPAGSTASSAGVRAVRAIPAARSSSSRWKTT